MQVRGTTLVFAAVGFFIAGVLQWAASPTLEGLPLVLIFGGFSAYALFRNGRDLWNAFRGSEEMPMAHAHDPWKPGSSRLEARLQRGLAHGTRLSGPVWNFIVFVFWLMVFMAYFQSR